MCLNMHVIHLGFFLTLHVLNSCFLLMANKIMLLSPSHLIMHYATIPIVPHDCIDWLAVCLVVSSSRCCFHIMALSTSKIHLNMRGTIFTAFVMVMSLFCLGKSIVSMEFEK